MEDTFLEIKWCREDIQNLLEEQGKDSSGIFCFLS